MLKVSIPKELRGLLRLGTCSWKYDSWKGLIYDPAKRYRPNDYLADYAKALDSVEVDQWFWSLFPGSIRLPEPRTILLHYEGSAPLSVGRFLEALLRRGEPPKSSEGSSS